jgi:hypothetical protein
MFNLFKKKPKPAPVPELSLSDLQDKDPILEVPYTEVPKHTPYPRVELGDLVRDSITEFEGIVTAKSEFLNKCVRLQVQPQALRKGKPILAQVFDEEQLIIVKPAAIVTTKPKQTGGDQKIPGRAKNPFKF